MNNDIVQRYEEFLKNENNTNKKLSYLTIKNYVSQIQNYRNLKSSTFNLEMYLKQLPRSIRKRAILYYLQMLKSEGKKVDNVIEIIKKIRTINPERTSMQTITLEELIPFIQQLQRNGKYELALLLMIEFDTGARIRAILKLRNRNIREIANKYILTLEEKRTKSIDRMITPETAYHLNIYRKKMLPETYIFFNKSSIKNEELDLKYYQLWSELKVLSKKYSGKHIGISFHWVRRGAGVEMYERTDRDLVATSEFLSHTKTDVTKRYLRLQAEKAKKVIEDSTREW